VRPKAGSAADRKLLGKIDRVGWTLLYITGDAPWPDFGFTVGLFANYHHPEITLVGIGRDGTAAVLTRIAEQVRDGRSFDAVHEFDNVLQNGYGCRFWTVPNRLHGDHFGTAIWFYQGVPFPVLQVFIPDVQGAYPWQPGFSGDARAQLLKGDSLRSPTMRE